MSISEFESTLNQWGRDQVPFLFLVDFEMENLLAWKIGETPKAVLFSINEPPDLFRFAPAPAKNKALFPSPSEGGRRRERARAMVRLHPLSLSDYKSKFDFVQGRIHVGDSYLTNLTIKTKIELSFSLEELFFASIAKYKLCWKNRFLVFSPEPFIQIKNGKIFSFPMKGTIDAALHDAAEKIFSDPKELSEHVTIVDLIRNDLSAIATKVTVNRFRYAERIRTDRKDLLQVSSEISGDLSGNYASTIGTILISLLPAGSVSGAPKKKTIQIIREAEKEKRGFYTGVFGCFDGRNLDSAVMIRFIEQAGENFYYRSGGGITAQSEVEKEYQEAIDKIYVPVY